MTQRETDKLINWKLRAKGKGLRWQLLRELVTILSFQALDTTALQAAMSLHKGLKHSTVVQMLDELKKADAVVQLFEKNVGYYWTVTGTGLSVFLGTREQVPKSITSQLMRLVLSTATSELDDIE